MSAFGEEVEFYFVQVMPMEEKRKSMGWAVDESAIPYLVLYYKEPERASGLIRESDVVLFGWTEGRIADLEAERLSSGKLSFRVSERIYREGQWKFISPRGLAAKYREHIRYRNKPVYLLCTGAYVASDFSLIKAYPGKMLKWGYFPESEGKEPSQGATGLEGTDSRGGAVEAGASAGAQAGGCEMSGDAGASAEAQAGGCETSGDAGASAEAQSGKLRICWAGRLIDLKHPEFAVRLAAKLKSLGKEFEMDIVGDGPLKASLEAMVEKSGLSDCVNLAGGKKPAEVRHYMAGAEMFLFTSNYLEGWGAVVNEAMSCGCAVVASGEAGAVPFLIKDGENGLVYDGGSYEDFEKKALSLYEDSARIESIGRRAAETIEKTWNAKVAAGELVRFCREFFENGKPEPAGDGPMSRAQVIKAPGFKRTLEEKNRLE